MAARKTGVLEDANVKLEGRPVGLYSVYPARSCSRHGHLNAEQVAASIAGHRLPDHQRFLIRHALRHPQFLESEVEALNQEILRRIEDPVFEEAFQLLQSIPASRRICRKHPGRSRR